MNITSVILDIMRKLCKPKRHPFILIGVMLTITGFLSICSAVSFISFALTVCGISILIFPYLKPMQLCKRFTPVYARIECVEQNMKTMTVNGRYPYQIHVTYLNMTDGNYYKFKSENIWADSSEEVVTSGITELPVHVDWEKPERYFVDISGI